MEIVYLILMLVGMRLSYVKGSDDRNFDFADDMEKAYELGRDHGALKAKLTKIKSDAGFHIISDVEVIREN